MSTQNHSQSITLSTLKFIKPADLATTLIDPNTSSKLAIVDVRDDDHIGGHIKSSQWVPINQFDARMPEVLRVNAGKDRVVFHCMLSQQRGPKAALTYARARAERVKKDRREAGTDEDGEDGNVVDGEGRIGGQEVCVLEGGFDNWRRYYAEDQKLTEGYEKDLWE